MLLLLFLLWSYICTIIITQQKSQKPDVEAHEQHSSWTNIAKPNVNYFQKTISKQQKKQKNRNTNQLKPLEYSTGWRPISSKTFLAYFMNYIDSFTMWISWKLWHAGRQKLNNNDMVVVFLYFFAALLAPTDIPLMLK